MLFHDMVFNDICIQNKGFIYILHTLWLFFSQWFSQWSLQYIKFYFKLREQECLVIIMLNSVCFVKLEVK